METYLICLQLLLIAALSAATYTIVWEMHFQVIQLIFEKYN
jgi:hypothetical protein